jgi:Tfp pilus assembly protein PilN
VVGALALVLVGVTTFALTGNQVSERKAQIAQLQEEEREVQARAESLRAFAEFRNIRVARTLTVTSLAQSRFDWERVMRELALVMPSDVWLINLTGTVNPGVEIEDAAEVTARSSVTGPALDIVGCAPSQEGVARFISALYDIDGVTRVGVSTSERPDPNADTTSAGQEPSDDDCRTRDFITRFEIVVAFDAVPPPPAATVPPPLPTPAAPGAPSDPALASATQQQAQARASVQEQTSEASDAASYAGG